MTIDLPIFSGNVPRKHPPQAFEYGHVPGQTGHIGRGTWSSTEERFLAKVRVKDGHWLWMGPLDNGYGKFFYKGRMHPAHRIAYILFVGEIRSGLQVDHACKIRHCVNPFVCLEPITQKVNQERGTWAQRTHCPQGHPYSEENTQINVASRWSNRICRTCQGWTRLSHNGT